METCDSGPGEVLRKVFGNIRETFLFAFTFLPHCFAVLPLYQVHKDAYSPFQIALQTRQSEGRLAELPTPKILIFLYYVKVLPNIKNRGESFQYNLNITM